MMEEKKQNNAGEKKSMAESLELKITMGKGLVDALNVNTMKKLVDAIRNKIDELITMFDINLGYPVPEAEAVFSYHDARISIIYTLMRLMIAFDGAIDEYRSSSEAAPGISLLMYEKYKLESYGDKTDSLADNIYLLMAKRLGENYDYNNEIEHKYITSMFTQKEKRKTAVKITEHYTQVLLEQKEAGKVLRDEYERLMKQAVPIQKLLELFGIIVEAGNEFAIASAYEKLTIFLLNIDNSKLKNR